MMLSEQFAQSLKFNAAEVVIAFSNFRISLELHLPVKLHFVKPSQSEDVFAFIGFDANKTNDYDNENYRTICKTVQRRIAKISQICRYCLFCLVVCFYKNTDYPEE
ncbi:hypothetical protein D917_01494 [Trichinella nativa]|uniref:Uncharacterized protein n=1 Tax=Trichinella nativa TaxID=6335 RepID=A0A1Y3EPT5_9BILA|nr:hypothetical protein D917_01494 [Trichinella nativa]